MKSIVFCLAAIFAFIGCKTASKVETFEVKMHVLITSPLGENKESLYPEELIKLLYSFGTTHDEKINIFLPFVNSVIRRMDSREQFSTIIKIDQTLGSIVQGIFKVTDTNKINTRISNSFKPLKIGEQFSSPSGIIEIDSVLISFIKDKSKIPCIIFSDEDKEDSIYIGKTICKCFNSAESVRNYISSTSTKFNLFEYIIIYKPDFFTTDEDKTDDAFTKIFKYGKNEEQNKFEFKLESNIKSDPSDWFSLYLLARNELERRGFNNTTKKKAADYLIKSGYEAIKKNEGSKLQFYLDKHKQEIFKRLFEEESYLSATIEGLRLGLEKNDAAYIGTPMYFLYENKKGDPNVNIDRTKLYNHDGTFIYKGRQIFQKFSISLNEHNKNNGIVNLTISWPKKDGEIYSISNINFQKHEIKQFIIPDDNIQITVSNLTELGYPFATIGIKFDSKKKVTDETLGGNIIKPFDGNPSIPSYPNNEILVNPDLDNDLVPDKIDKCKNRAGNIKDGCPELIISVPLNDIYENEFFPLNVRFDRKPGDRFEWTPRSYFDDFNDLNGAVRINRVGRHTLSLTVENISDNILIEKEVVVFIKVNSLTLEQDLLNIAQIGNYGSIKSKIGSKVFDLASNSEQHLMDIIENLDINVSKEGAINSKLSALLNQLKTNKREEAYFVNKIRITNILYSNTSGKINGFTYYIQ